MMRCDEQIRYTPQWGVFGKRFGCKDIQRSPPYMLRRKSLHQVGFLDHIATGYIDEKRIFFHHIECIMVK